MRRVMRDAYHRTYSAGSTTSENICCSAKSPSGVSLCLWSFMSAGGRIAG